MQQRCEIVKRDDELHVRVYGYMDGGRLLLAIALIAVGLALGIVLIVWLQNAIEIRSGQAISAAIFGAFWVAQVTETTFQYFGDETIILSEHHLRVDRNNIVFRLRRELALANVMDIRVDERRVGRSRMLLRRIAFLEGNKSLLSSMHLTHGVCADVVTSLKRYLLERRSSEHQSELRLGEEAHPVQRRV